MIKSWMVIAAVTFLIAIGGSIIRPRDIKWFRQLRRPSWLTFEPAIPILDCGIYLWSLVGLQRLGT
jgi:benzodiazapine receptor